MVQVPSYTVGRVADIVLPADTDISMITVFATLQRGDSITARNAGVWKRY